MNFQLCETHHELESSEENQIIEFDFLGVSEGEMKVYLIEVKTGRGANIRHYARNPMQAFSPENIEKAKAIGFKVALVVVELFENWKYGISYREM